MSGRGVKETRVCMCWGPHKHSWGASSLHKGKSGGGAPVLPVPPITLGSSECPPCSAAFSSPHTQVAPRAFPGPQTPSPLFRCTSPTCDRNLLRCCRLSKGWVVCITHLQAGFSGRTQPGPWFPRPSCAMRMVPPKPPQGPGELGMAWDDELIYNLGRDALASLWMSLAAVGTM